MLIRLVIAIQNKNLEKHIAKHFSESHVQVQCIDAELNAWNKLVRSCADIIVVSDSLIPHPIESGIVLLNDLPEKPTTVILQDSESSEDHARLVAAGADVVLFSGSAPKSLADAIETTLESRRTYFLSDHLQTNGRVRPKISDFISDSEEMQIFMEEVRRIIQSDSNLTILGETGTGKEHLAKAIHAESPRSAGPFITVHAAAIPDQLLESELFGHEQGSFTGAVRSRRGAFELAHKGTLFLDEIGEMPLHLQVKLLRVLQDFEIRPIGGEKSTFVDVRVIAATNKDLEKEIERGNFRKDLFYRLNIVTLTIPPLRKHKEDISGLARYYVHFFRRKIGRDVTDISDEALKALCGYNWPGNIRELMNVIERAILLSKTDTISIADLPSVFHAASKQDNQQGFLNGIPFDQWTSKTLPEVQQEIMNQVEKIYLEKILKKTNGRVGQAAVIAGIHPRALYNKMKRLQLRKEDYKVSKD